MNSLRRVLAESHVSVVTIAVLLLWSFEFMLRAVMEPLSHVTGYLVTAIAILGIPSTSLFTTQFFWSLASGYCLESILSFAAAWGVAHWVYKAGPVRALTHSGKQFLASAHA